MRTTSGADWQAAQMGGSPGAAVTFIGLTANATAPAAGDTVLTGEITTAGGGLARKNAVYAHTTGTASYTLTVTFTANGTDVLPVTVNKYGVFNAAAAGVLAFENAITAAAFAASGDNCTITETVNL